MTKKIQGSCSPRLRPSLTVERGKSTKYGVVLRRGVGRTSAEEQLDVYVAGDRKGARDVR